MTRPTIEELETLLNSDAEGLPVYIRPDGSIVQGGHNTVERLAVEAGAPKREWPDPTPQMLADPKFEAVWQTIKSWDINVPGAYSGYMGATGNHVRAILDALKAVAQ